MAGPTRSGVEPNLSHLWETRALGAPIMDVRLSLICLFVYFIIIIIFCLISHYDMRENILIVIISINNRHLC